MNTTKIYGLSLNNSVQHIVTNMKQILMRWIFLPLPARCGNFCSASFGLSIGIYDADFIKGNVEFRLGNAGENYQGINKGEITIENRFTIADETGPFGNPSSDSNRTKITVETKNVLFVIYAPANYDSQTLQKHTDFAQSVLLKYCSGKVINKAFLTV